MDGSTVSLVIGVLTFISGIASLIISRRKINSESHTLDADAFDKFQTTLTKLQERNDSLYQENVTLQVAATTDTRTIYTLTTRLEERDAQLLSATKQLDLLREMARTAPITETLTSQVEHMQLVINNMQNAQNSLQQLLKTRESAYNELFNSTHDLIKKK